MKDKDFISSALKVIEIESNAVKSLSNQIQSDFDDLCTKILDTEGRVDKFNKKFGRRGSTGGTK